MSNTHCEFPIEFRLKRPHFKSGRNPSGQSLTISCPNTLQTHTLLLPPVNDRGFLYNNGNGILSWRVMEQKKVNVEPELSPIIFGQLISKLRQNEPKHTTNANLSSAGDDPILELKRDLHSFAFDIHDTSLFLTNTEGDAIYTIDNTGNISSRGFMTSSGYTTGQISIRDGNIAGLNSIIFKNSFSISISPKASQNLAITLPMNNIPSNNSIITFNKRGESRFVSTGTFKMLSDIKNERIVIAHNGSPQTNPPNSLHHMVELCHRGCKHMGICVWQLEDKTWVISSYQGEEYKYSNVASYEIWRQLSNLYGPMHMRTGEALPGLIEAWNTLRYLPCYIWIEVCTNKYCELFHTFMEIGIFAELWKIIIVSQDPSCVSYFAAKGFKTALMLDGVGAMNNVIQHAETLKIENDANFYIISSQITNSRRVGGSNESTLAEPDEDYIKFIIGLGKPFLFYSFATIQHSDAIRRLTDGAANYCGYYSTMVLPHLFSSRRVRDFAFLNPSNYFISHTNDLLEVNHLTSHIDFGKCLTVIHSTTMSMCQEEQSAIVSIGEFINCHAYLCPPNMYFKILKITEFGECNLYFRFDYDYDEIERECSRIQAYKIAIQKTATTQEIRFIKHYYGAYIEYPEVCILPHGELLMQVEIMRGECTYVITSIMVAGAENGKYHVKHELYEDEFSTDDFFISFGSTADSIHFANRSRVIYAESIYDLGDLSAFPNFETSFEVIPQYPILALSR